jgi:hypothetical protein
MKTSLKPYEVKQRASDLFSALGYSTKTSSENQIVYEDGRDVNWLYFVLLLLCVLVGAIIYYFIVCKKHEVIINVRAEGQGSEVTVSSTTSKSSMDSNNFINQLPVMA